MKSLITFCFIWIIGTGISFAGDTTNIPIRRQIFHDRIVNAQKTADLLDGTLDGRINLSKNDILNDAVTDALFRRINVLRNDVEVNNQLQTNNDKIKYLNYLSQLVQEFSNEWLGKSIDLTQVPLLVNKFEDIFYKNIKGESMVPDIRELPYHPAQMLVAIFTDNPGYEASRIAIFLKHVGEHPEDILTEITPFADQPFADSLITVASKIDPIRVYTYAQSSQSPIGRLIRNNKDKSVKEIVRLTHQTRALFYFPFLDDLIHDRKTIESIEKYVGSSEQTYDKVGYYKLLVQTEIEYFGRVIKKDTPVAMYGSDGLLDMLQRKAIEHFITPINDLHESPDNIRFKAIETLDAQDLYYMMILGEEELYTSSYKYSFTKMMSKLGRDPHGDSLLLSVNFDRFKKFIKMAASYNRLDEFLATLTPQNAGNLMRAFVLNLENTTTLEDAVDVADSYGSINNPLLQKSMLANVEDNLDRVIKSKNQRGISIYTLLKTIFLSADPKNKIDLSKEVGIPPIYTVTNSSLTDSQGRIIEQVFFYGDKDGIMSFASYMGSFPSSNWQITHKSEWVEIKSTRGRPIWIFANKPLDNESSADLRAIQNLNEYMAGQNLIPTIIIHRGHSYHLPNTVKNLPEQAKIVMLGSCGGYQNLSKILSYSPDAHIISSKQTGAMNVNKPIIDAIDNTLIQGKDIDWREMWSGLTAQFDHSPKYLKETFEDYIPPQKNLGALFIKAYKKMTGDIM